MASAAEQMAANTSWATLAKAKDLRQRIVFAIGLLIVYRLGTYIPVPGIDGNSLREFMTGAASGIGGMLNMFTGGAIARMGIFALGIMPYISASIIVQLVASMYGPWTNLRKEGELGRRKLNQYTRYGTVFLALVQSYGLAISLEDAIAHGGELDVWSEPGRGSCFRLTIPRHSGELVGASPLDLPPDEGISLVAQEAEA